MVRGNTFNEPDNIIDTYKQSNTVHELDKNHRVICDARTDIRAKLQKLSDFNEKWNRAIDNIDDDAERDSET